MSVTRRIRLLDPERGRRAPGATPSDPALLAIIGTEPTAPEAGAPVFAPRRPRRSGTMRLAGALATLAMAGGAIGLMLAGGDDGGPRLLSGGGPPVPQPVDTIQPPPNPTPGPPTDMALEPTWITPTPVPTPRLIDEEGAVVALEAARAEYVTPERCARQMSQNILADGKAPLPDPVVTVLTTAGEKFSISVATSGKQYRYCFGESELSGRLLTGMAEEGLVDGSLGEGEVSVEVARDGAAAEFMSGYPVATAVVGRVGPGVERIYAATLEGPTHEATIDGGWWGLWIPAEQALESINWEVEGGESRTTAVSVPLRPVYAWEGKIARPPENWEGKWVCYQSEGPDCIIPTLEPAPRDPARNQGAEWIESFDLELALADADERWDWALGTAEGNYQYDINDGESAYGGLGVFDPNTTGPTIEEARFAVATEDTSVGRFLQGANRSAIVGRTGNGDLLAVTTTLRDGTVVTATVDGGWWMILPLAESHHPVLTFTWRDGSTTSETIDLVDSWDQDNPTRYAPQEYSAREISP